MTSPPAEHDPVNLRPEGPSMDRDPEMTELVDLTGVSPRSVESEQISSPHTTTGPIDLEEEDPVPQSWEQRTRQPLDMETLIRFEREGIAEGDFYKSWARMEEINNVELERHNPQIDRSKVKTYHISPDCLESLTETSFRAPKAE